MNTCRSSSEFFSTALLHRAGEALTFFFSVFSSEICLELLQVVCNSWFGFAINYRAVFLNLKAARSIATSKKA